MSLVIDTLPDYLRTPYITKGEANWPETFDQLKSELILLDAKLSKKYKLSSVPTTSPAPSPSPSTPKVKAPAAKPAAASSKRPEKPSSPCRICNKNLLHWSDQCPEKDKKPSENTRYKASAPASEPTLPATGLASSISPTLASPGFSRATGLPLALSHGDRHLTVWSVVDDCNLAWCLITESTANHLGLERGEHPFHTMDLGGKSIPLLALTNAHFRIASRSVLRPAFIVQDNVIPIPDCSVLLTADDADSLLLERGLNHTFRSEGLLLNTTRDFAGTEPHLPSPSSVSYTHLRAHET